MEDNNQLVVDAMWDDLHKKGYFQKDKDTFDKFFFAPGEEGYNNRYKLWKDLHSKGYLESPTYEDFAARIGLQPVQKETTAPNGENGGMKLNDVQGTVMGGVAGGVEPGSYAQNFAYGLQEGADKNINLEGQNSNIKGRPDLVESLNNYGSTIKTTPTTTTTTITKPSTSPSGGGSTGNGGSGASWSTGKSVTTSSGKTLRVVPQEELYVDDKGKPALGVTNEDVQSIERSDLYYPLMRNDSINLRSTEAFRKGWLANPKYDKNRKFKEAKAAGYKAQGEKFKNLTDAELVKAMREEEKKLDGSTNPEALQASMNVTYIETLMAAREWGLGDVANLQTAPNMVDYHQAKAQFNKNGLVDKYENNMLTGKDDNPLLIRGWEIIEEQWAKDEAAGNRRSASYYRNLPFHNPKFAEEFGAYITARIKRTGERWNDAVKDAIDDFEVAAEEGRVGQRHSEEYLGSANREQVDELLGNVNSSLEKRMAELDKKESDMGWFSNLGNVGAAPDTKDSKRLGDPEYGNYLWAGRALNDAKKIIAAFDANTLDDGLVGFFKGAGRGLVDSLGDLSTWDGGISDLLSAQRLDNAVGKFINGKPLTKSEKALLEATSLKMATAAIFKEIGRGYKAGKVTGASLPFMIDMALNPLSKSGNTIAKGLAKYAQKHLGKYLEKIVMKLGRSSAGKIATKILGSGVTKKAVKAAARAAGDIVAAGGMSATSGVGHSLANAYGYHSGKVQYQQGVGGKTHFGTFKGGDDWVTSTLKGFGSTTIENASEMWGEYFKPITKFLSGVGGKALEKMHLGAVNRWLEDINSTEMARLAADFRKQTRWDGSIAEYFEEVAGNIANALTIKDMNFALHDKNGKFSLKEEDSVFNAQDNLDTFLGVSLMSGTMGAVNIVGYRTPKYRAKQDTKRYGDMAKRIFAANGNDWSTIASLIQNNNEDSRRQLVVDLMQSGKYSKREKQIALQYAGAVYKSMGMDIGESKQQRSAGDQEASEAYGRGYNMATLENIGETSSTYQQLRTQMEQDYGTELMQRMDKEPGLVYGWIRNGAVSEEDAKKVLDYLNAKMAYEGSVDRLNDDEAAAKSAAELQVEDSAYKEENGGDGQIHPVTLKGREGEFFVVSGDVVTGNDGAVDVNASSDAIVVVDNQGKRQMTTAKDIDQVGDVIDVESAKADAVAEIETAAQETTDATATDDAVVDEDVEQGEEGADGAGAVGNYDGVLDAMGIEDDQARQALNETWGQTPPADAMDVLNDLMGETNPEQRESNKEYWAQQPEVFGSQWRYMMGDVTPDQVNAALAAQNETAAAAAQAPAVAQGQAQVAPQAQVAAAQSQPQASTPTPQAATTPGHYEQDDDVVLNVGGEQITGFISNVLPDGKLRLQLDAPINGNVVVDVTPEELDKMVAQPQSSGANAALAAQYGTAASAPTTPTIPEAQAPQAAPAAPEAPQQESAQPSLPVGEDGNADFSNATPQEAHDYIYNDPELDEEEANQVVQNYADSAAEELAKAQAVLDELKSMPAPQMKDYGRDMAGYKRDKKERNDSIAQAQAAVDAAQREVDLWNDVQAQHMMASAPDVTNQGAPASEEGNVESGETPAAPTAPTAPAAPQETAGETQAPAQQEESSMLSANESGEPSSTQTNEGESGEETAPAAEEELTPDERIERARMQALENRAEELAATCGIPVRICRSLEEIPARYRKAFETARGTGKKKSYVNGFFFHKKTANGEINEIVLYLPDIAANGGMWRLERTFLHEAVAHGGLRALFQNAQDGIQTFNDLCDKVWNEIMPTGEKRKYRDYVLQNKYGQEPYEEIKKQYRKEGKSLDDLMTDALKREAADEYMAHQAEWGVDRSILDKIIKAVRDALRKIKMINKRMRLSDRDVLDLLAASHRNLTEMDKQMLNQDVADELDRLALAGEDNGGSTLMSTTSIMEGGGLEVSREITDKDGKVTKEPLVDDEGNLVAKYNGKEYSAKNPITAEDLREGDMEGNEATVLQMLINDARDAKNITDEQAAKIYQNYADMINLFLKCGSAENGGADTVMENWEWLGESVFRAVSANGDAQYSYSMDITKVCKKNEAVIKSISALQLREGRGATPSEIVEIYRDTHVEGYQVPCPVCYVFTRYIRNGKYASAAITGMEEYGEHLPDGKNPWTLKQWRDELNRLDRTMNPDSKQKCTDAEKEQAKRFKKQLDEANDITVYYEDRVNALSFLLTSKFTSEARKKEILEELRVIDAQYKAAVNIIARQSLTNWIKTFAIQEKDGKWTMREDAKIPEDMDDFKKNALDLRLTANTILNYPAIQRLRKSGGSAAGKEISFPSDNRLGEVVSGLGINKSNLNTYSNVYEEVLKAPNEKERKKLRKKASDRFKAASEYAQQQTLRGGQRMWSWSDNIERLSPDIAINIMQLQLLGGAMQTYSKQLEGIKLAAQMGAYVNGSLMAKDNGWEEVKDSECYERDGELWLKKDRYDFVNEPRVGKRPRKRKRIIAAKDSHVYQAEDGRKYVLVYDDVVGVDPFGNEHNGERKKGLFQLNSELDRAGNILVGMNDLHVRAAMADPAVFFIIPWHSSGAHNHILNEMLEILGQHMTDRLDYTAMQEEKNMLERNKDTKKLPEVTQRLRDLWEEGRQWAEQNKWKSGMEVDSNGDVITESQYMYRALRGLIFDGSIFEAMPTEEQYQVAVEIVTNMQATVDELNARNEAWKAKSPEYKKSPEGKAEKKEIDDARTKANKNYKPAVHTIELHDGLIDWRDSSVNAEDAEWQAQHPKRINVEEARRIIEADEFLKQVYDRVSKTPGQKMTSGDNTYIYPYEYWQETDAKGKPADIKDADINGKRYVEYCRRMGYKPKFSGNWKTGDVEKQNQGNFVNDKGYWKLLIDRRMYDRNGKYQWLDPVDSDNFETSLVDPRETHKEFHVTTVADDKAADEIAQKVFDRLSTRTESGFAAADYNKPLKKIMDEYDAALEAGVQNGKIKLTAAEESMVERMKAATVEGAEEGEDSEVMFSVSNIDELKDEVLNFFHNSVAGIEQGKGKSIGKLTEEGRRYLEKISGLKMKEDVDFLLNPSDLLHIHNEHYGVNEKDKGNNEPLTDDDIRNMVDVIANPDRVIYGINKKTGNKVFLFLSGNPNGTYNLAEIYTDRRGNLTAKSFYNTKKTVSQRVNELLTSSPHLTSATEGASSSSSAKVPTLFQIHKKSNEKSSETTENGENMMLSSSAMDQEYMAAVEAEDIDAPQAEAEANNLRFSVVEDPMEIAQLEDDLNRNGQEVRYRAMVKVGDGYVNPMASKLDGKMRPSLKDGKWEKSEEQNIELTPEMLEQMAALDAKDGGGYVDIIPGRVRYIKDNKAKAGTKGRIKFHLVKSNGKDLWAAYNPYLHSSDTPLNDQFKEAWNRPDMVVVKVLVPKSDIESGYKAEHAKDKVGNTPWHSGTVNSALPKEEQRTVTLSRYSKIMGEVSDSEAADMIAKKLLKYGVSVPFNTVTPSLREALVERGVQITEPEKKTGKECAEAYEAWKAGEGVMFSTSEANERSKTIMNPRAHIPKVRGGWTEKKILRYLKGTSTPSGVRLASRAISEFDSVEELKDHMFYHGTVFGPSNLKPSITMSDRELERVGGGGYGDKYWGISVSKSKRTSSLFSGTSPNVKIYPIILKKGANVIERPDFSDAWDAGEHIVELWDQGIDAVWIGEGKQGGGEQELLVLNPNAIVNIGTADFYKVYHLGSADNPLNIADDKAIAKMYDTARKFAAARKPSGRPSKPTKPLSLFRSYPKEPTSISRYKYVDGEGLRRLTDEEHEAEVKRAQDQYEAEVKQREEDQAAYDAAMEEYERKLEEYNNSEEMRKYNELERQAYNDVRFSTTAAVDALKDDERVYNDLLGKVFSGVSNETRRGIVGDAMENRGYDFGAATEAWLMGLADDETFAQVPQEDWRAVKNALGNALRENGVEGEMTDNEARYVLWKAGQIEDGVFSMAEDIVKRDELLNGASAPQYTDNADVRFSTSESEEDSIQFSVTPRDRAIARDQYDRMMRSGRYQFVEAVQDSMLGLKKLMEAIMGDSYEYIEDIPMYENPYITENLMSSSNAAQQHEYSNRLMAPILKEINKLTKGKNKARNELIDYMMAKHGLERNQVLADRDAKETAEAGGDYQEAYAENRERDYAGLTALTGEDDVHAAEAKAQQMVAAYEQQHDTTELWDKVNAATKTTLAKLYQCGIMSKETYQKTRDMFEYYIPLRGYDEKTSDKVYGYLTSKDGPLTGGSIMKRAGGRTSKADDPIATIAMMADKAITEGNRNLMKQTFLNFVRNHPSDAVSVSELWLQYDATKDEWVPVFPDIPADASPAEVEQITEQFEADMQQLAQQEPDKYKHGRETANIPYKVIPGNEREHQVLVKMRGQTYVLTINGNPRAAQAINGLTNPDTEATKVIGKILEKAQAINRGMSAVYTTMNPDFVVSNFLRDMYYANTMVYVKEKGNYGVRFNANVAKLNPLTIYYLLQKWENGTLNENRRIEKLFKEFMLNGGETGYTTVWDVERYKKSIDKELRKQNNIALKAMGTLGGQLEMFNRSVENVARFAAFVTSVEMGRSYGRAAYDAKEISVNFNKKGSGGTMFGATGQTFLGNVGAAVSSVGRQFFVFWNAGVQGMTNFGRNTKRHPVKGGLGAASLFGLGILIPLLAGAGGGDGDDEDKNAYYNLPEYIRRSNLCIYADGKWVTIPLPVEYRAIYGLGELAYGVVAGKERYSDEELAMQISSQFSQLLPIDMLEGGGGWHPFIPTLLKPIVETGTNTSWSGLPIHPDSPFDDGKYMPEYTKVYQSTDKDLIKLSEFLNRVTGGNGRKKGMVDINPANIEYWLNGYLGGLFTFPIKVKKSAETFFGDREFEWKNIPFANRVIKEGDERTEAKKLKNEFFKYKEEYEETKWRLQGYGKDTDQGIFNYAKELADMNYSKEYGRYVIFDKYAKDFEDLEKIKKRIADGTLPAEMKQEYDAEDMRLKRQLVEEMHAYEDGKYTPDKPKAEDQYKPKEEETKVTIQKHASSFDEVRMVDEFSNTGNQYKPANNDVMVEAQKLGMKMRYYKQKNKVKHELGLSGSTWNLDGDKSAEKKRFYNSHKALLDRVGRYRWREREIGRLMDEAKEKKSKEASNYKRIYQIIQDDIKDEKQFQRSQKK